MHPDLAATALRQGGVFTTAQARAAGYSDEEIRHRRKAGRWTALRRGVYTVTAQMPDPDTDRRHRLSAAAALLAYSSCQPVLSHGSAAVIHGMDLIKDVTDSDPVTLTTAQRRVTSRDGVRLLSGDLPADHTTRVGTLALTTAARTVVDLARQLEFLDAVVVADSALQKRLVTPTSLRAVVADCASWPGGRDAQRVVDFADGRAESAGESLARVQFAIFGVPAPELNVWIGDYRVDFLWREFRVIGEFDGMLKYVAGEGTDANATLRAEKRRQEQLEQQGWIVVRFTWAELMNDPAGVAIRLFRAFERGRALV